MEETFRKYRVHETTAEGVYVATAPGKSAFIDWATLRGAASQYDPELASQYTQILRHAEPMEATRLISEDWKTLGYPLRTGFDQKYRGQTVMKAWEIRRKPQTPGMDGRIAYIVALDRSDNTTTRTASPAFSTYDQAEEWVGTNYGGWHDELSGENTASVWFRD